MQRRTLFSAALAASAAFSFPALADDFKEGTDYVRLSKPLPSRKNNVIKIFSYDCPFCFRYDIGVDPKAVPMIEKAGLTFEPRHLETKGKYGRTASEFFAMCILKDEKAGRSIEAKDSLFKKAKDAVYFAYHRAKAPSLIRFAGRQGSAPLNSIRSGKPPQCRISRTPGSRSMTSRRFRGSRLMS